MHQYFITAEGGVPTILIRVPMDDDPVYAVKGAIVDSAEHPTGDLSMCQLFSADWKVLV